MRWRAPVVGLVAMVLVATGLDAPAHAATYDVTVADNSFSPDVVKIQPGDTVRWTATTSGHTVTAEDRQFDFHPGRTLEAGEQVSHTFEEEGLFPYRCRIHPGMEGLIQVGTPPVAPVPPGPTLTVPDQAPTITAAAAGAAPGTEILIRPGVYREEITVTTRDLVLRGLGERPDDVVLDGGSRRNVGVTVAADDVRIANLAIAGYRDAGVVIGASSGTVIEHAMLRENGRHGIDGRGPDGMTIRDVDIRGHGVAGIAVRNCGTCGARIDRARLTDNAAGVVAAAATGVVVRGSHIDANAVGIVLRDVAGAQVSANTLTDNDATDVWVASAFDQPEPPTGAGVWIVGGTANLVDSNVVTGHTYNVAVTGPPPAVRHRVADNTIGHAVYADLGWDGLGAGVCFDGNHGALGEAPTSDPPAAESLYDCARTTTAGIPYPVVSANLTAHARSTGYPL